MDVDELGLDDPLWEYTLMSRLEPYIPYMRKWWAEVDSILPEDTGVYTVDWEDQPPGMFYRFTSTCKRSPIKGIQCFPFIVAGYLQLTGIKGGSTKLIQRVLSKHKKLDEFELVELHNLPSTFNQGQLVAFVPATMMEDARLLGKWIYLTADEISSLIKREVTESIFRKAVLRG